VTGSTVPRDRHFGADSVELEENPGESDCLIEQ